MGVRWIRRRPVASLVSILCLGLGIGASATAFTLVDATVLSPYGLTRAGDLVVLWESDPARPRDLIEVSLLNFQDWERRSRSFVAMAAFGSSHWPGIGRTRGEPFPIAPRGVSRHFFRTLGRAPMLGRDFSAADLDASAPPPVMLSHAFWVARFGASPDVVGQTVYIDNAAHLVVGVMPRGFAFPDSPDVWISVERALGEAFREMPIDQQRMVGVLEVVGRLNAGVASDAALGDLNDIAADLQRQHYPPGLTSRVVLSPFTDIVLGRLGERIWIALGMTAAVLLFACANVAAVRLAHLRERSSELVAHLCLGATGRRLVARLLAETTPLLLLSALAALVMCVALETWLGQLPSVAASGIDLAEFRVVSLAAVATFSAIAYVLVSVAPALAAARGATPAMSGSVSRSVLRGSRSTSALLMTQSALAICLVAMAGGAFRTFARLASTDVGFATSGVTALDIAVPEWKYAQAAERGRLDERLLLALKSVPGVTAAAGVSVRPFRFGEIADGLPVRRTEDAAIDPTAAIGAGRVIVTPEYFAAMGITISHGRALNELDRTSSQPVAVISQALARMLWGESPAVGRTFQFSTVRGWQPPTLVVGVAEEVRSRVIDRPALEVYIPHGRGGLPLSSYVVRHDGRVITEPMIRGALQSVDSDLALERVQTTRAVVDEVLAPARLLTTAMTVLGTAGLTLLALGIFGAAATTLGAARGEVAIRQAVGATPLRAARASLRSLLIALAMGMILGIAIAPGALGVLASLGVADTSGMAIALVVAGAAVASSAALAVSLTLRRAMKISPAELLRAE